MAVGRQPYLSRVGKRYARWTVIEYVGKGKWRCKCDCGNEADVWVSSLTHGGSQSCGCLKRELHTRHGLSYTAEKNVHTMMIQRCYNPNHDSYPDYGGRGIKVCDRWLGEEGLENFYADMGARPTPLHKLERKNNDGDYGPENCVWATDSEQARNTSRNVNVTWLGQTLCMKDWAELLGIGYQTLAYRIKNWGLERAMTEATRRKKPAGFIDHQKRRKGKPES